jgi:hypothetical protein
MVFDIQEWFRQKQEGEILVSFFGDIYPEVISNTLNLLEEKLDQRNEKNPLRKKVYNVFVECFQNLYHHVDVPPVSLVEENAEHFGVILLTKEGEYYRITSGNFIKKTKFKLLKERIEQLNSLSESEIKSLYRDILSNDEYSQKGGGGLGMLDIVRKTGNKLNYNFIPADNEHLFFSLDVYIS